MVESTNPDCQPHPAIVLVSAYLVERGLILKTHQVDKKTNEMQRLERRSSSANAADASASRPNRRFGAGTKVPPFWSVPLTLVRSTARLATLCVARSTRVNRISSLERSCFCI